MKEPSLQEPSVKEAPKKQLTVKCTCQKKKIDDMTYSELANQKPADAIENSKPLPLTEQNLSAMNQSAKEKWTVRS